MDGMWFVGLLAQAEPAAAAAAEAVKSAAPAAGGAWQVFAIAAIVFILPFILGQLIAQALKLKDTAFPIGVVLCAIFLSMAPFLYKSMIGQPMLSAIPLGIDLAGGTNLIFAVDREQAQKDGKPVDNATLNKMVGAIGRRINPGGAEEVTVRRVGDDRIEIIIPGADKEMVARKKRQVVDLGSLEFAILANDKDHAPIIESAKKLRNDQDELVQGEGGRVVASWRTVAPGEDVRASPGERTVEREVERTGENGTSSKVIQLLVIHDPPDRAVTGRYLTKVAPSQDNNGQLAVSFNFGAQGARLFSQLTGRYQPDSTDGFERCLAVLLNGQIQTAPHLKSRISGSGQISGNFTKQEIDDLVNILNAGALEVPLIKQPVSEFTISPTLGADVQTKGFMAIIVSLLAVLVFMLVYYRVAGIIAVLCLVLNLLLVVGTMAFIEATFTLPGLAGLILTIGMAVDSNVLIYERIREELARGSSLRMAIENGFDKALSSIVDGNVSSLLTAAILYLIGSDQIRGFAVSLFIGLAMSMFTVLYFGHLCFNIIERKRWVKTFSMMQLFGQGKFDYIATQKYAFAASFLFIAAGLGTLFVRGKSNLDIDFTGGTMVTFEFVESETTDEVRAKLVEQFGSTLSLERLVLSSETAESSGGHRFRMRTTELDQGKVTEGVAKAFSSPEMELRRITLAAGGVEPIPAAEKEADANRFSGGHEAPLTFSSPIAPETAVGYLADALKSIQSENGTSKYEAAASLIAVKGTGDAAVKPQPGEPAASKFTTMTAQATSLVSAEDLATGLKLVSETLAATPAFEEVNSFATSVAFETQLDALYAMLASLVMIIVYIWYRFEKVYFGFAAVAALAHDVLVTLGGVTMAAYLSNTPLGPLFLFEDFKINLALIASLLTIVGYSLNDTIVIFDRLREIKGKNPKITYDMINASVNQTMSRTILTFLSTFLVVVVLYIFGGSGIHGFAFSMIVGCITGVYSTIYIANPILFWLVQREEKSPAAVRVAPPGAAPTA